MKSASVLRIFYFLIYSIFLIFNSCSNKENLPTQPTFEERIRDLWGNYPELGEGTVTYTVLPIDTIYIDEISPLGHLSLPGHPIPTSHIYWELSRSYLLDGFNKPVRAPANGVITKIIFTHWANYPDYSVVIRHTNSFMTQFNHLSEIDSSILKKVGQLKEGFDGNKTYIPITAGEIFGKTAVNYGQSAALDMGTYYKHTTHFIHPEKYPLPNPNAVCPLDYFENELKQIVFSKVKRIAEPRGGEFDFDQPGKLVGNWFLEGTDGWSSEDSYKNYLSFVYDMYDPKYLRISLGEKLKGTLTRVKNNAPDFKDIDVKSGPIVYKLYGVMEGDEFFNRPLSEIVSYTLLVQMINDEKIKIELFDGDLVNPSFSGNVKYYIR